jgi:hypothetical protein
MGRTYLFECPKCEYSARVSGREDRGFTVCVQTIVCRDCRRLYDAVVRLRVSASGPSPATRSDFQIQNQSSFAAERRARVSTSLSNSLESIGLPGATHVQVERLQIALSGLPISSSRALCRSGKVSALRRFS